MNVKFEIKEVAAAWERALRYPVLVWLPVVMSMVWIVPMSLIVPGVGSPVVSSGMGTLMLLGVFLIPAVSGGYNEMVGAVATGGVPSASVFRRGWGKYYGRIIGGAVLMAIISAIFMFPAMGRYLQQGQAPPWGGLGGLMSSGLGFFVHIWFAALILGARGILDTAASAWRSLVARPQQYLPLLALSLIAIYLIPAVPAGGQFYGQGTTPALTGLSLLSSAVKSAAQAVVRLGVFMVFAHSAAEPQAPRF